MVQQNNLSPSAAAESRGVEEEVVPCAAWQDTPVPALENLRGLQVAFLRLFVADQVAEPLPLPAEELLTESSQARSALLAQLKALCTP
jgi:hypothetical protein